MNNIVVVLILINISYLIYRIILFRFIKKVSPKYIIVVL